MKIVSKTAFMQMPKGTVFCKFPRFNEATRCYSGYTFGIDEPCIKTSDMEENDFDFFMIGIGSSLYPVECNGSEDFCDILSDMERNLGKEVPFAYSGERDGLYEDDNEVCFAIFSRDEIELMIKTLQEALEMGYKK